jgi:hypothetical protein
MLMGPVNSLSLVSVRAAPAVAIKWSKFRMKLVLHLCENELNSTKFMQDNMGAKKPLKKSDGDNI